MNKAWLLLIFISHFLVANQEELYERFKKELSSSSLIKNPIIEQQQMKQDNNNIYYFISFSMNDIAIKKILEEAQLYHIPVLINGMVNDSLKETIEKFTELAIDDNTKSIGIDPTKFEEFYINSVPVLVVKCQQGVDKISGNIPIKNALEKIVFEGDCQNEAHSILEGK